MAADNHDLEFEVGFGKPPERSRFRKGASGNPAGRPRGRRNLATVLARTLQEKVITVDENGVRRKITKLEAAVNQLVDLAASGDLRALRQLTSLVGAAEPPAPVATKTEVSDADQKIVQNILQRAGNCTKNEDDKNNEDQ